MPVLGFAKAFDLGLDLGDAFGARLGSNIDPPLAALLEEAVDLNLQFKVGFVQFKGHDVDTHGNLPSVLICPGAGF